MFGYELLYRHSVGATACTADGDLASARVLTGAVLALGLDAHLWPAGVFQRHASASAWPWLNAGETPELMTLALLRARACELVGDRVGGAESSELFLVGLFSLLDVMLSRTMAAALGALPLSATALAALTGEPNGLRAVLDAVVSYERGDWDEATLAAGRAGLAETTLAEAYTSALRWSQDLSSASVG